MLRKFIGIAFVVLLLTAPSIAKDKYLSSAEIRTTMIKESIASYPGNCPCPYNAARNGSRCGKRSAYSRRGGYAPLCYSSDISDKMVEDFRIERKTQ